MTPEVFDHLLALLLVVVMPFFAAQSRRDMERFVTERGPDARRAMYLRIMLWQWSCAVATITLWVVTARSWPAVGISWPAGWGFAVALALTVAVLGYCTRQLYLVRRRPDIAEKTRESAAALQFMLPSTPTDMRVFAFLCLTAGVVEELLYRGFLLWYLSAAIPLWAAVLVSSVVFGIGHVYQGWTGALQTGAMALVMAGLYVLAGSLWAPMLLHGAVNYLQVRMMYDAMRSPPAGADAPASTLRVASRALQHPEAHLRSCD